MRQFLLVFILVPILAQSQQREVRNIVFEGAGIRGIAYCGAIAVLEQQGILARVEKVGGTSAGAITAMCVSLGYSSKEIEEILYSTNFRKFNDGRYLFPGGIFRLSKNFGWYRGVKFRNWIEKLIETRTGNPDLTFAQLYNAGYKDLYVTATVLNRQEMVVLSRHNYPDMKVRDAVRISVSIPLYYQALFVDSAGKVLKKPGKTDEYDIMIDGGLTGNYPIAIFDSIKNEGKTSTRIANPSTIGFRIDREEQVLSDHKDQSLAEFPVTNLKEYIAAFYSMSMENLNRQQLVPADWSRTVSISDGAIGPRVRKMKAHEIRLLIENGRKAAEEYFNR